MSPTISFASEATSPRNSIYSRPAKKAKMSITRTYFLAHSARGKLSKEAARADHDLRLLVGHANMLDQLMLDLASAEQEQEQWFNQSVSRNTIEEETEDEEEEDETPEDLAMSDVDADWTPAAEWAGEEYDQEVDDETDISLSLTRTKSRSSSSASPPELTLDADSDSEEDEAVPSPPEDIAEEISEKHRQAMANASYYDKEGSLSEAEAESFEENGYFIPSRSQPTIIAAF